MSLKKKRPAQSVKRMMNLLFELDSKEEMLKKLNRFCEHRDFFFIPVERKKKDKNQLEIPFSTGDEEHFDGVDFIEDGNGC